MRNLKDVKGTKRQLKLILCAICLAAVFIEVEKQSMTMAEQECFYFTQ